MVVMTPSTIMPLPTCDNYDAFWGIFDPTETLAFHILAPKFDAFILAPKSASGESLVKFRQKIARYRAYNVSSELAHHGHTNTLET